MTTAAASGLLACMACAQLSRRAEGARLYCPRCGARLRARKADSLQRTWACLLAAACLYYPANVWPIMSSTSFLQAQSNTILSGVVELWVGGDWPLALIVFFASIVVPGLKIVAL